MALVPGGFVRRSGSISVSDQVHFLNWRATSARDKRATSNGKTRLGPNIIVYEELIMNIAPTLAAAGLQLESCR